MSHRRFSKRAGQQTLGWLVGLTAIGSLSFGCTGAGRVDLPAPIGSTAVDVRGQDTDDGFLDQLKPSRIKQQVKAATGFGPNRDIAEQAFQEGEALFVGAAKEEGSGRAEKFSEAAKAYAKAADRWPDSAIEEDALFMQAESNFFADQYPASAKTYELLCKKYPNTRHMDTVDKRRFALAKYWIEHQEQNPDLPVTPNLISKDRPLFDKFGHGVRVLDKIRFDDPTGRLADDATMAAGVAHFKQDRYQRADEFFTDLRQSFPDSEHQFQAHLLSLQCKLKIYQGPQYSVTPMDEAEQLIKQMRTQFPQESEQNLEYLTKAWQEVRLKKAEHDFQMAEYYRRRKEYDAARQYYTRVRENYSDTSLATEAATIMGDIADSPGKPDQPLPWLANMFPTPEREKPLVARNPLEQLRR